MITTTSTATTASEAINPPPCHRGHTHAWTEDPAIVTVPSIGRGGRQIDHHSACRICGCGQIDSRRRQVRAHGTITEIDEIRYVAGMYTDAVLEAR